MMENNIGEYLAGILSLPPMNGDDTTAPFVSGEATASAKPALATGVASSTGNQISDITGAPYVSPTSAQPSTSTVPFASQASDPFGLIATTQYAGIALLGVVLLGIGLYILISPSATKVVAAAGV
jgi:hypothetical protein